MTGCRVQVAHAHTCTLNWQTQSHTRTHPHTHTYTHPSTHTLSLGNISPLVVVERISNLVHIVDPATGQRATFDIEHFHKVRCSVVWCGGTRHRTLPQGEAC